MCILWKSNVVLKKRDRFRATDVRLGGLRSLSIGLELIPNAGVVYLDDVGVLGLVGHIEMGEGHPVRGQNRTLCDVWSQIEKDRV